jgi:hypothetical protein
MPPVFRLLQHGCVPRDGGWNGQEHSEASPRGRALVDIEFLMLHPLRDCLVTSPVRHMGLLAYMFPMTLFHVYNCEPKEAGQKQNVYKITSPLNDSELSQWSKVQTPYSVIFTDESDARQLAHTAKMAATASLFCWRSLPTDHLRGDIFFPLYSNVNSTTLFLHHTSERARSVVTYDTRALGEEVSFFNMRKTSNYDSSTEYNILIHAITLKLQSEGHVSDPIVVGAVAELLQGLLPHTGTP